MISRILAFFKRKPLNFIDPSSKIGQNVKIWHYAVILQEVIIGNNCSIGSGAEIGRASKIGNNTRISSHVFLPPHSIIGENVFIGPGVIMTDDKYPIANNSNYHAEPPIIEDNVSIGAGAVILPGILIKKGSMIGAGSVVTKDVEENSIIRGEPSRQKGVMDRE